MTSLNLVSKAHFIAVLTASALVFSLPHAYAANRVILGNASATALATSADVRTTQTLKSLRSKVVKEGKIRVIVGVRAAFAAEGELTAADVAQQRNEIAAKQLAVQGKIPSLKASKEKIKTYSTIPFMALEVDATELEALAGQADITSIEEDRAVHVTLAGSVPLIGGTAAWSRGYTGAGQTVAILDTGVDKTHPFFTGKIVSEACYSTNSVPAGATSLCPGGVTTSTATGSGVNCDIALSGCFHGTHVAGIAAGTGVSFSGVAKNASIIAMQIFTRSNSASTCGSAPTPCIVSFTSDYNLALERVFALRGIYSIAAVNMSIGGGGYSSQATCDAANSATKTVIDNLRSVNIATIIASGNESFTNQISSPGCISTAISVGATSKTDVVASYSNSASFLKLLAPGSSITSSYPGSAYATASGTSMAAPHVAGAWALLKQQNAARSVTDTLSLLTATGIALTDAKSGVTTPRIRLDVALNALPTLSYSSEVGYGTVGVSPSSGTTSTLFTYKVIYTDASNTPPTLVRACVDSVCNTMSVDVSAAATLRDNSYINGEQYVYSASLAAGTHAYYFTATDGTTTVNLPASGSLASPVVSGLTITTPTLPDGIFGASYSQTLVATGGVSPYSWSSTTLPAGLSLGAGTGIISGTPTVVGLTGFSASVTDAASAVLSKALSINVGKATPVITWPIPAAITYPTALSATQLSATANVPGTFAYTPAAGTVLNAGTQSLSAVFTPTEVANYNSVTALNSVVVNKADQTIGTITFTPPTVQINGSTMASATATSGLAVTFSSTTSSAICTVSSAGAVAGGMIPSTCVVEARQIGDQNYNEASVVTQVIAVIDPSKIMPAVSCATPTPITYLTPLSLAQFNCTATDPTTSAVVGGTYAYSPALGTVLNVGTHTLAVNFTPTDAAIFSTASTMVTLLVNKATQTMSAISFSPATLAVGGTTTASATATSGLPVTFSSMTPTICSVSELGVVLGLAKGACSIHADQGGDDNYLPAFTLMQNITVIQNVDLIVNAVSKTAATVGIGHNFTITNDIRNQGSTNGTVATTVAFYLSTDAIITTADVRLTGVRSFAALPTMTNSGSAGTIVTVPYTVSALLPSTVATKVFYVGACADVPSVQPEATLAGVTLETNNCKAALGTITVRRNVDLIVSSITFNPKIVGAGGHFTITTTVKNVGTTPMTVPSFMVGFYLSKDAIITTLDIKIGSRVVSRLMAGQSSTAITTVTVPGTVLPGVYFVGACADTTNVQIEATLLGASLEGNNCKAATGTINVVRNVDLIMSAVSSPDDMVIEGMDFIIDNTVKNAGTAAMLATPITTTKFYLSTDAIITSADTLLLGTRTVAGLAAGASSRALTVVTLPISVLPGVYYIGAIADGANQLIESVETNNSNSPTPTSDMITVIFDPTP